MNRPEYNRLREGDKVQVNIWENSEETWVDATITAVKTTNDNRSVIWVEVDTGNGQGIVKIEAGYNDEIRRPK